ncbi:hypothetical protein K501DRAFT_243979 [Backusella circina FSU 941]|nr:hypothetical protein K501DRAFT_243979 [Backusella circina FSU 941]
MAIQLVPKISAQTTKQVTRHFMTLPVIVVFLLVFFFVSTMKVKVVYSPAAVNACPSELACGPIQPLPFNIQQQVEAPQEIPQIAVTHRVQSPPKDYPFTIVTASSANHLCSLENFLYSLYDLRSEIPAGQFPRIVVYNIGMNRTQLPILDQFVENGLVDNLEIFDYFKYPRFWDVAINAGEYAWKTGIVNEARLKYAGNNGLIVWLDAGNIVTPQFIRHIPQTIKKLHGFWSPRSAKTMAAWTHPGMFDYFGTDMTAYGDYINCNGAAMGFDVSNETIVDTMILPWLECGMDKRCIAPPGSSRANHRQDQAALTMLAYMGGFKCNMSPNYYKLQTHRDKSCRAELMALDIQKKLNHPSSIDFPKWYASNTLQLYHHPEWRYPEDQVPEQITNLIHPPSGL